ncbi:unnamed protein product (macronuclear) [Paramecium tetraurelia]|uniref:Protein kinase domain-containing protein n=1 Tax=Paramecium tetraurelia TaxID=5888 RepID=A0BET2_PARTE|nr:uncharacterized protein GSPATT00028082001 [Paramecium tetraurelia]CAK57049.1 unnamed protein product [Paramecium tetraurelia]|eukprot:XP_001424447.1 hypothetical protein (macronuclear) [Paramecium tetraurelia strain d4-2]
MQSKFERSFFDEQTFDCSFWEKSTQKINVDKIEHQYILFQKSRKTGFWVSRNYIIFDSKLVKLRPNKNTIHQINLNKSRVEKIKYQNDQEKESCNKKKYGFRIIRNQRCREFYSRSKEMNQKIWEELKKQSLQISFKQDYVIEKIIGKGNFAKVYLCNKKSEKQQFAVKAFEKSKMINTETDRLALLKEISILRKLNYKGLIKMYEVYEDETHIYLVQDYLQGGELYQHIKKNQKQPEQTVARIIATLLESLEYLHKNSILHRDLKPENLILRKKGVLDDIVIADFGLADFYDPLGNYIFQRCGTPGFVAPEVLQDKLYDSKVDIFSIGCLMYLLLAGKSPFKGSTYDEVVMRNYHCKIDYQSIESVVSIQCLQLIKLLLHHRPSQRPAPKEALRHEWFMLNLDEKRYKELNNNEEQIQYTKETTKSSLTDVGSCGFMKNFVGPYTCEKSEFSTPQITHTNNKQNAVLYTPQYAMMQSIQEQFKDSEQQISIKKIEDEFSDMMFEDESPQSHKLPQYQLIGKLKQVVDSNNSSYYASPIIKRTPESNTKGLELRTPILITQVIENHAQPRMANKVMNNLKNFEQV